MTINRAKCKLCESVIESFFQGDVVTCKCGEITVYDGAAMRSEAKDYANFLRVNDKGVISPVTYVDEGKEKPNDDGDVKSTDKSPTIEELAQILDSCIEGFEKLPDHAKYQPVTHFDFNSFMLLIREFLKRVIDNGQ